MPVSSSSVMNTTPLALPGRCRTSTTPAQRTRCRSLRVADLRAGHDASPRQTSRAKIPSGGPSATAGWSGSPRPPAPAAASRAAARAFSSGCSRAAGDFEQRQRHVVGQPPHRPQRGAAIEPDASGTHRHPPAGSARAWARPVSRAKSSSEVKGRRLRAATMRSAQSSCLSHRHSGARVARTRNHPLSRIPGSAAHRGAMRRNDD